MLKLYKQVIIYLSVSVYSPEDYEAIIKNNDKILVELESIENQGWDKKKERIARYVENSRILLNANKLPVGNKKEFASYMFEKITEYTTISRNDSFYLLFKEDEVKGFEIIRILLVCHGGHHNDTICTVERKI